MSVIDSTTGHNAGQERSVAKILYLALIVAVVLGMIFFFSLGHKSELNPTKTSIPAGQTPATPSDQ